MTDAAVPSARMGKYRLLGELGRGGMAHVYLALVSGPAGFNKLVVVKRIQAELASDPDFITMFLDEARLAARLNHPNVVQTNEVGQEGSSYFIAMEYLEGQTFRKILSTLGRGAHAPLRLGMKLRVLVDALIGLHHAHELADFDGTPLNVVHRDVSPDNIFVTYNGQVKVVDFGIAKALGSTAKTQTGMIKGKVSYMSPEHACGEKVDQRADIFSVGVILWEVATGQRLFSGMPDIAVLHRLTSNNIPQPGTVNAEVDARLEAIVMKALAYEAKDRFQSAAEFAKALETLLAEWGDESNCRQVGALASASFAGDRERIRLMVEEQIQTIQAAPTVEADNVPLLHLESPTAGSGPSALSAPPPLPDATLPAGPEMATALTAASTVVTAGPSAAERTGPSRLVIAMLLLSTLVGGVAAAMIVPRWLQPEAAVAPAEQEPKPPAALTVRIASEPAGAIVKCSDRPQDQTPAKLAVDPGERLDCTIHKDGYEPQSVGVGPLDSDHTVEVKLAPLASASASASSSSGAPPVQTVRPPVRPPTTGKPPATNQKPPGGDIRLTR